MLAKATLQSISHNVIQLAMFTSLQLIITLYFNTFSADMDQPIVNPSLCDSTPDQLVVKQEPDAESVASVSYDDAFIGAALLDSLRNVPDPLCQSMPRGKKNPIVTLDSIKKELHHECKACGKRFRKTADYFQHQTTHSNPLDCDLCTERFYKVGYVE